jgi:succinate dehydrogenase/fumarate reductase-like Fe-S protein
MASTANERQGFIMASATHFVVRILRQDRPQQQSYWQRFRLEREPGLNLTATLQRIAAKPLTTNGQNVAPVAYDSNCLEEVCGACTMLVNGRVRQACTALVDRLLENDADTIELRPMSKFPVIRDLVVDRKRLFRALEKLKCWISVDGTTTPDQDPSNRKNNNRPTFSAPALAVGAVWTPVRNSRRSTRIAKRAKRPKSFTNARR